jgi:hypothetical protein
MHCGTRADRRRGLRAGLALLPFALALAAASQTLAARYARLATPTIASTAAVHENAFTWEGLRFLLSRGTLALDATVNRRGANGLTTAVFDGEGTFQVLPPNTIEAAQMRRYTGRSPIEEPFTQAVFRFTDGADFTRAMGTTIRFRPGGDGKAASILKDRAQQARQDGSATIARLLQALDRHAASTILLVQLKLRGGGWISAQYDPDRREPLRVYAWRKAGGARVAEIWTEFAPSAAKAAPAPRLSDYAIRAAISGHFEMDATAAFRVAGADGSILLGLARGLRVESARSGGANLAWLQPPGADWVYVELPAGGAAGAPLTLRYRGKAPLLEGAAADEESSLSGWYPTLPRDPPWARREQAARYDLRLEVEKQYALLATGTRIRQQASGGRWHGRLLLTPPSRWTGCSPASSCRDTISEWRTQTPVPRAGFAFGKDEQTARTVGLADGRSLALQLAAPRHNDPGALLPLAGTRMVNVLNALGGMLGPFPFPSAGAYVAGVNNAMEALPPQPMLIPFDPQAFLDISPEMTNFGPGYSAAGQWFGAWMRPATAHDAWLTEGLRAFSALMYVEAQAGPEAALATLQSWRSYLLHPGRGTNYAPVETGPLWLGAARLSSPADSGTDLLTVKGAYTIYMLRQMMVDPRSPQPNAAFDAMLRDFVRQYGGRAVTSAEFEAAVEKHMTPPMNLTGDHSMAWFFGPAIEGTAVPTLTLQARVAAVVHGVAQVRLTVENPDGWVGLLPVYLFRDAHTWVRGTMPIRAREVSLTVPAPFVPKYVEADHLLDMLVRIRQ